MVQIVLLVFESNVYIIIEFMFHQCMCNFLLMVITISNVSK